MELISKLVGNRLLSGVLLFLFAFALYSPSLKYDFVWDDVEVIAKNNYSYAASTIIYYIIPGVEKNKQERYYRPAVYISMVIDRGIWGISPFGFHLSNVIFNSISVVLFYIMILLILKEFSARVKEGAAFLSALLFALHPMHVESVSWVAGRTDVLCALFLFLAFISHILSYRSAWFLLLTGVSFTISLFSKEVGIVFPILVLVFDLLNRRLLSRGNILKYAVYLGISLVYLYLRGMAFVYIPEVAQNVVNEGMRQAVNSAEHVSKTPYYLGLIKILLSSYLIYLNKLILPFSFNAFITGVPREFPYLISSLVLMTVLSALGFLSIKKKENVTAFGIFWILLTLGPSALVALFSISSSPLAERYLYIPSAGFCLLIGYWVIEAGSRMHLKSIAWGFGVLLIILYAFAAYQRQAVWKDDLSLWRDTSLKSPDHPLPHSNYGLALSNIGEQDEAVKEFEIALSPEMNDSPRGKAVTANNMGLVYIEREDYPKAELWFRKALEYDPGYGKTYYHMGLIYFINGELTGSAESYTESERYLRKALERYKYYGKANLLLAKVYLRRGEKDKALAEARAAIEVGIPGDLLKEAYDIIEIDHRGSDQKPH